MAASRTTIPVQLTAREASELLALTNHQGYAVLIKLMDLACKMAVKEMLDSDSVDPAQIVALQQKARASNDFLDRVSNTVDWIVGEIDPDEHEERQLETEEVLSN